MNKKYFETKSGSLEEISTKIATEQPTITKEEPKIKLERKTYLENKPGSLEDAAAKVVSEGKEGLEEKFAPGFAVRCLDPKNGKRFVVPLKTKKEADDKAAMLKWYGMKDVTITKHKTLLK